MNGSPSHSDTNTTSTPHRSYISQHRPQNSQSNNSGSDCEPYARHTSASPIPSSDVRVPGYIPGMHRPITPVHMSQGSYGSTSSNHGYGHNMDLSTLSSTMPYTPTRSQDLTRSESITMSLGHSQNSYTSASASSDFESDYAPSNYRDQDRVVRGGNGGGSRAGRASPSARAIDWDCAYAGNGNGNTSGTERERLGSNRSDTSTPRATSPTSPISREAIHNSITASLNLGSPIALAGGGSSSRDSPARRASPLPILQMANSPSPHDTPAGTPPSRTLSQERTGSSSGSPNPPSILSSRHANLRRPSSPLVNESVTSTPGSIRACQHCSPSVVTVTSLYYKTFTCP